MKFPSLDDVAGRLKSWLDSIPPNRIITALAVLLFALLWMAGSSITAFLLAFAVFVAAVGLALVNAEWKILDTTSFIAVLIIPLLTLAVASGKLQEFSVPGGWSAKFLVFAHSDARSFALQAEQAGLVEKVDRNQLSSVRDEAFKHLAKGEAIYLALSPGQQWYTPEITALNIEALLPLDRDLLVVILTKDRTFFSMSDASKFWALLMDKSDTNSVGGMPRGQFLIDKIKSDEMNKLRMRDFPELVREPLQQGESSNADALHKMLSNNLHAMVIVNRDNEPTAIAKRDVIVGQLVGQLVPRN